MHHESIYIPVRRVQVAISTTERGSNNWEEEQKEKKSTQSDRYTFFVYKYTIIIRTLNFEEKHSTIARAREPWRRNSFLRRIFHNHWANRQVWRQGSTYIIIIIINRNQLLCVLHKTKIQQKTHAHTLTFWKLSLSLSLSLPIFNTLSYTMINSREDTLCWRPRTKGLACGMCIWCYRYAHCRNEIWAPSFSCKCSASLDAHRIG